MRSSPPLSGLLKDSAQNNRATGAVSPTSGACGVDSLTRIGFDGAGAPMSKDRTFHIRPVLDGQTLAAALHRLVPALSWADAKQLIAGRHVHVNGNLATDEARRLKAGDVVKVFEHAKAPVP